MSKQAKISSVDALDTFRAAVVQFRTLATRGLSGVYQDVRRMQSWIGTEQPMIWRQRVRKCQAAVDNARSDLERAKISRPNDNALMFFEQRKALEKARTNQREAEERLQVLKQWGLRIDHKAMLLRSGLQPLMNMLEADMELLLARLGVLSRHLEAYLKLPTPPADFDAWAREMGETISPLGRSGQAVELIEENDKVNEDGDLNEADPEPDEDEAQ